jgi:hypothetical protein
MHTVRKGKRVPVHIIKVCEIIDPVIFNPGTRRGWMNRLILWPAAFRPMKALLISTENKAEF